MLQQVVEALLRARVQLVALVQAQGVEQGRVRDVELGRVGGVAHQVQDGGQRRHVARVGGWDRVHGLLQLGQLALDLRDVGLVAAVAHRPAHQQRGGEHADARQGRDAHHGAALLFFLVDANQALLGKDHIAQQAVQEETLALAAGQRGHLALHTKGSGQRAHDAVDGRALLRAAGEVDAAQQRALLELAATGEDLREEVRQHRLEAGELLREGEHGGALEHLALRVHAVDQAVAQALLQRAELAHEITQRRFLVLQGRVRVVGQAEAPHLVALFLVQLAKAFVEAGDQVGLGDQHVHGHAQAQLVVQLLQARAQLRGVLLPLVHALLQQVLNVDGQDHAIQRATWAGLLQQGQKAIPGGGVNLAVGFLRGVAAGGVDQHGLVGEPPIAIARAAHALHRGLAQLLGQREVQARVHQGRGFARARRADEDVPRQLVEVLAALEQRRLARSLKHAHRLREALVQRGHFTVRRRGPTRHALHQRRIRALALPGAIGHLGRQQQEQHGDDRQPHPDRVERARLANGDQRPDPPDDGRQREQAQHGQEHGVQEHLQQLFHAAILKIIERRRVARRA